ncbi:MAG: rhodanese-like domain-containing protein [Shewanella sp.]
MKKSLMVLAATIAMSGPAMAYDTAMASSYQKLFAPAQGAKVGKELHLTTPENYLKMAKQGDVLTLDVRTEDEQSALKITLPNTLNIPANEVFLPQNLAKLPKDKQIAVMCQSGLRATAIGTALRHIGFDNVVIVKKGLQGVAAAATPNWKS